MTRFISFIQTQKELIHSNSPAVVIDSIFNVFEPQAILTRFNSTLLQSELELIINSFEQQAISAQFNSFSNKPDSRKQNESSSYLCVIFVHVSVLILLCETLTWWVQERVVSPVYRNGSCPLSVKACRRLNDRKS